MIEPRPKRCKPAVVFSSKVEECLIRSLAVTLDYIPDGEDVLSLSNEELDRMRNRHGGFYEFLLTARSEEG